MNDFEHWYASLPEVIPANQREQMKMAFEAGAKSTSGQIAALRNWIADASTYMGESAQLTPGDAGCAPGR